MYGCVAFFFSSRRRHTRYIGDWSSDVCSSDLEVSGYDPNVPGRAPRLLEGWSVRRLADAGAHCIKVLLYYALLDAPEIMERKRAWVERVGWECAGCDVPFFLEIVPYQDGVNEQSPEFARCKPDILTK